jgi:hypothetical protein
MTDITIYGYDQNGYYNGQTMTIGPNDGHGSGWITTPVPTIPTGQYARLDVTMNWVLTDQPSPPVPAPPTPAPSSQTTVAKLSAQLAALQAEIRTLSATTTTATTTTTGTTTAASGAPTVVSAPSS